MDIQKHKFITGFSILTVLLILVPQPLSLVLLLYFPGVFLTSLIKKEVDTIEVVALPFLFGMSFWIVFSYFVSDFHILHWVIVLLISFACAVIADKQNIRINRTPFREGAFLLVCCLFMVSYSYPWSQFFHWFPPGDDMKYHLLHIENIVETHSLPETYGELYPEVDTLTYPLGYTSIIALASMFSGVSLPFVVGSTFFMVSLACFSFYFLGKSLFNKKTGLYSAFSISFLSLFFHRLLATSTYPNVLGITLQVFAFYLLFETLKRKSIPSIVVSALAFAASGLTHSYILLLNVLFLSFLGILLLLQKEFSKVKSLLYTGVIALLLSIPYIVRLEFQPLTTIELWTFTVWYQEDSFRSLSDLVRNVSFLSPFLLFGLFGIFGGITLKKNSILVPWGAAILVIPLLSAFQIQYPGWYTISPNRVFFYLCAPVCILCGKFFADLERTLSERKFLSFMVITALLSVGMHHFNLFHSFSPDPVSEVQMNPDDAFVIQWITDNTPEDIIILNTGPIVDCSSWVPVLSKRKVVFPSFSGHRGDKCLEKVGAYRKCADLRIIEHVPDSGLALQILEKYTIGYIYIPAFKKRSFLELHPESLLKSPLYHLVLKKGNAYLFRVNYDEKPEKTFFIIQKYENITMEGEQLFQLSFSPLLSGDVQKAFFLQVEYTDNTYGRINISEDSVYTGTILKYKTGEEKSIIYPLSGSDKIDLLFYCEFDFFSKELIILYGLEDAVKVSEHIGLKGSWVSNAQMRAPAEDSSLRVYLFNVDKGELVLQYKDTGYGNVDINVSDALGVWSAAAIIRRENSGETKEVRIPLDKYSILVLGVYVYGEDFTITEIQYEPYQAQAMCEPIVHFV